MLPYYILSEESGSINSVSYLNTTESGLFLNTNTSELFFGSTYNDLIEIGIYNSSQEPINFYTFSGSSGIQPTQYSYSDIDGNIFIDSYDTVSKNFIQDTSNNVLFDLQTTFNESGLSADNFYVSLNPLINFFSKNDALTIKEISNSKKEIRLINNFDKIDALATFNLTIINNEIFIDGKNEILLQSGGLIKLNTPTLTDIQFDRIKVSTTKNGDMVAGGVQYVKDIIFKKSEQEIIIDTFDGVPPVLWIYYSGIENSAAKITFSSQIDATTFRLNSEFLALDDSRFINKQIYSLFKYQLSTFNVSTLYNKTKDDYQSQIDSLKTLFGLKTDDQVYFFIRDIYYGFIKYDILAKRQVKIVGIQEYILNNLRFNYELVNDFNSLYTKINKIIYYASYNYLLSQQPNINFSDVHQNNQFYDSIGYLCTIFGSFLIGIQATIKLDYIEKFTGPLRNALNFGNNNIFPILSSKINYSNTSSLEFVVKLKDPLPDDFAVGNNCNVSNISINPFYQIVNFNKSVSVNTIKIGNPNFGIKIDNVPSSFNKPTKYYSASALTLTDDVNHDINTKKKIEALNIDYSDFSNFVVFSSAHLRVKIFENKIIKLTLLNNDLQQLIKQGKYPATFTQKDGYSNIITFGQYNLSASFSSSIYQQTAYKTQQINDIINSFDNYESYLYNIYTSGSFVYDINSKTFIDASTSGSVFVVKSSFITDLENNAAYYDKNNRDSLVNNIPEYVYNDSDNDEYLKFLSMIGHHFDNIYIYISNLSIYKQIGNDINTGLSRSTLDLILNSFGFNMPPSLTGMIDNVSIDSAYLTGSYNSISLNDQTKIVWKRILSNLPAIYKTKGTQESIRYILSCYGIPDNLVTIKEFGGGYTQADIDAWNDVFENEYYLEFIGNDNEYVRIDNVSTHKSIDFKVSVSVGEYNQYNLIELYSKFDSVGDKVMSVGFIKGFRESGQVYIILKNNIDTFSYVSNEFPLFVQDSLFGVLIRRNDSSPHFEDVVDVNSLPTLYDIGVVQNGIDYEKQFNLFSFYLSGSFNDIFDTNDKHIFGNYTAGFSPSSILRTSLTPYKDINLIGTLDKFEFQSNPLSNDDFLTKNKNLNSYYNSSAILSNVDNNIFRFDMGYPIDIQYSSSLPGGYKVINTNQNFLSISASLFNFTGSSKTKIDDGCGIILGYSSSFPYQQRTYEAINKYFVGYSGPGRYENDKVSKKTLNPIKNVYSDTTIVSPNQSMFSKQTADNFKDTNKFGVFLSPVQERNDDILNFFGTYNIISSVSNPYYYYDSNNSYEELNQLRDFYYSANPKNKILFNELFTIYKTYVDKSVFETLKNVLPARNKVYSGLLVEPSILERNRIPQKPIGVEDLNIGTAIIDMSNIINKTDGAIFIPVNNFTDKSFNLDTSSGIIKVVGSDINPMHNFSYVDNNFNGFECIKDVPDKYQLGIYCVQSNDGATYTEYYGDLYKVFVVKDIKYVYQSQKNQLIGSSSIQTERIELVLSASSSNVPITDNYSYFTGSYYNNLTNKYISYRKTADYMGNEAVIPVVSSNWYVKSKQTEITTINDPTTTNRSPIIATIVAGQGHIYNSTIVAPTVK